MLYVEFVMFYIKTESVDKLRVPFGIIIGLCTVLSNIVKLIGDAASLGFKGLLSIPLDDELILWLKKDL